MKRETQQVRTDNNPAAFTEVYTEPGFVLGHLANVSLVGWSGQASVSQIQRLSATQRGLERSYGMASSVTAVAATGQMPAADARREFERLIKEHEPKAACVGIIVYGDGFRASAVRGLVTSLHFVQRRSYECKVAAGPDELLKWFPGAHSSRTGVELPEDGLRRALLHLITHPNIHD